MIKNKNSRGFTLIEVLLVVAIGSVLLMYVSSNLIFNFIEASNYNNKDTDLQTGVKISMDEIASTLKNSTQIHLVGKQVYQKDANTNRLDKRYNYIALRDIDGNQLLVNLVYNEKKDDFDILPIVALSKKDLLKSNNISYEMQFYTDDDNYQEKMNKNILNFTVKGVAKNVDKEGNPVDSTDIEYQLSQDLYLSNANQITISKYINSGNLLDEITAIAYENGSIKAGKNGASEISIVIAVDASNSMSADMNGDFFRIDKYRNWNGYYYYYDLQTYPDAVYRGYFNPPGSFGNEGYWRKKDQVNVDYLKNNEGSTRNVIAGNVIEEFLADLSTGKDFSSLISIDTYIYDYHIIPDVYVNRDFILNNGSKYIYPLDYLTEKGYGPYDLKKVNGLEKIKKRIKDDFELGYNENQYKHEYPWNREKSYSDVKPADDGGATNTGEAILTALEILNQLDDKKPKYFVLLTDGDPNGFTATLVNNKNNRHSSYNYLASKEKFLQDKNYADSINARSIGIDRGGYDTKGGIDLYDGNNRFKGKINLNNMDYIKEITSSSNGLNKKDLYNSAYVIGFSSIDDDKKRVGLPDSNGRIPKESIAGYLGSTGNNVKAYDADSKKALEDIFKEIKYEIGEAAGVFDGPNPMK